MGNNGDSFIPRILIVESFGGHIKSLSKHLESLALPLQTAAVIDAEAAMVRLERETIDLLIIDTCLRGKLDGYDLCRSIRSSSASYQRLPIILLLAGYLSLERARGIAAGADLLLHRPVVKEELIKMIQLLLGRRSDQQAEKPPLVVPESHALTVAPPVS